MTRVHRSPRGSKDMDVDLSPRVPVHTLQRAVSTILHSQAFLATLLPHGIVRLDITTPKQTAATQRWKISLMLVGDTALSTAIEFSRRPAAIQATSGIPDAECLRRWAMIPFAAQYYDAAQMAVQKILALASPSRHAARDLFDLHHLWSTAQVRPERALSLMEPALLARAIQRATMFTTEEFHAQVVPYLPETLMAHYQHPGTFELLRDVVTQTLSQKRR